jgi:alpha-tubulin suppressor-like RCC1 family protein
MRITALGVKQAEDIFTGKNHSFFINAKGQLHAWGKNGFG